MPAAVEEDRLPVVFADEVEMARAVPAGDRESAALAVEEIQGLPEGLLPDLIPDRKGRADEIAGMKPIDARR